MNQDVRIAPGGLRELGLVNWAVCRAIARASGVREARLFTTLGRHGRLFRAWLLFASFLMPNGALPAAETELAILRVAFLRGCRYEMDHHIRLGRRRGLSTADIDAVLQAGAAAFFAGRRGVLIRAVDGLVETRHIEPAIWSELRTHYDERQLIELCILVGHYEMLATAIAALGIERDFGGQQDEDDRHEEERQRG
ncbi:carboxymuconolactone decarboxylase family protein [Pendulispora rubella]|uniref:Carboxymuconolactone decarboxylase family protein n=1 Tax=Pendulispora rubella TaxID=2741070 RepID=A0ABZ2LAU9_9BACT